MTLRTLAGALLALACVREPALTPHAGCPAFVSDGRVLMGTVLEISLCAPERALGLGWLDELYAEVTRLERILTRFDAASDLARANARAGQGPAPVPPELARIVDESLALTALTHGAFDATVGPLAALWREAGRTGAPPSRRAIALARACVGPALVQIDRAASTLALAPCAALDLGGIAKGWTLDRLVEMLRGRGVSSALLDFGGSSLAALGTPPDASSWGVLTQEAGLLQLREQSLSVSGSLGQSVEIAGHRYGHVIDPRSGQALVEPRLALALAANGARAEALSKALLVLGPDEGIALVGSLGDAQGLIVTERGERWSTPGFDAAVGRAGTGASR